MKPGSDMPCGAASSLTPSEPPASESRMPRRVESASAANTESRSSSEMGEAGALPWGGTGAG